MDSGSKEREVGDAARGGGWPVGQSAGWREAESGGGGGGGGEGGRKEPREEKRVRGEPSPIEETERQRRK